MPPKKATSTAKKSGGSAPAHASYQGKSCRLRAMATLHRLEKRHVCPIERSLMSMTCRHDQGGYHQRESTVAGAKRQARPSRFAIKTKSRVCLSLLTALLP